MLKKSLNILLTVLSVAVYGQNFNPVLPQKKEIIENFMQLSRIKLFDTANYYYDKNSLDTAFICYSLLINTSQIASDIAQQKNVANAYNKIANIYYDMCDYHNAYSFYLKGLEICEKTDYEDLKSKFLNNIGNIYKIFKKYDIAKSYYTKALEITIDSSIMVGILNNMGAVEFDDGKKDNALYYYKESMKVSKIIESKVRPVLLSNIALFYHRTEQNDSAFHYYNLALNESENNKDLRSKALVLTNMSDFYLKQNMLDSAYYYVDLSKILAMENNFSFLLAENYRTLSRIEESKGNIKRAFEYYKSYTNLKDSVYGIEKYSEINQLQRLHDISKTNQLIEKLVIEKQVKERTIYYKNIIWYITLGVLFLVIIGLIVFYLQNRKINKAYKVLFEKNIELVELNNKTPEINRQKYKKSALSSDLQNEMVNKILNFMEDVTLVCDPEFSINKLAMMTGSNHGYISQVINTVFKKNFNSFLNSYRISEAQRIFSTPEFKLITIETVSNQVGFNSVNTFRNAFREVTGVTPSFYVKSMKNN